MKKYIRREAYRYTKYKLTKKIHTYRNIYYIQTNRIYVGMGIGLKTRNNCMYYLLYGRKKEDADVLNKFECIFFILF